MNALTVFTSEIRQLDGLYSLNDLHKAAGGSSNHKPANFMRLDTTTALIDEIRCSDLSIEPTRTIRGGKSQAQGTYVCRELVYAYAMWISPKFHLAVIRAFDAASTEAAKQEGRVNVTGIQMGADFLANRRFLLSFTAEKAWYYTVTPVPDDAYVMTPSDWVQAVQDGGTPMSTEVLLGLVEAATARLKARLAHAEDSRRPFVQPLPSTTG